MGSWTGPRAGSGDTLEPKNTYNTSTYTLRLGLLHEHPLLFRPRWCHPGHLLLSPLLRRCRLRDVGDADAGDVGHARGVHGVGGGPQGLGGDALQGIDLMIKKLELFLSWFE